MRNLKNNLTTFRKGSTSIQSRRGKSFGYQVLGFGSGGAAPMEVDYLVVAGGGGGGSPNSAGGGAGGMRFSTYGPAPLNGAKIVVQAGTTYPVAVGAGGAKGVYPGTCSTKGTESSFNPSGTDMTDSITSAGGGTSAAAPLRVGGSGSNGAGWCALSGAAGNTPPTNPSQGNPGGDSSNVANPGTAGAGGGGGASAAGYTGGSMNPNGGTGGAGVANNISGSSVTYAGGGGSGNDNRGYSSQAGSGGPGGGGGAGAAGTTNTGGGGGGGMFGGPAYPGGIGGPGRVEIRVPADVAPLVTVAPGTNTYASAAGDGSRLATFTISGTLAIA